MIMASSIALDRSPFLPPNVSRVLSLSFFSSSSDITALILPMLIIYNFSLCEYALYFFPVCKACYVFACYCYCHYFTLHTHIMRARARQEDEVSIAKAMFFEAHPRDSASFPPFASSAVFRSHSGKHNIGALKLNHFIQQ